MRLKRPHISIMRPTLSCSCQLLELAPGVDSSSLWREVALHRECLHPHIVPLFGVALKVRWPNVALYEATWMFTIRFSK